MITDHLARPGPDYWAWRCLTCSRPVDEHEGPLRAFWRWLTS